MNLHNLSIEVLYGQIQSGKKKLFLKTHEHMRSEIEKHVSACEKVWKLKVEQRKVRY